MNKIDRLLFIYCKDGKSAVLDADEAQHDHLMISNGWKHTATIDPHLWVAAVLNEGRAEEMIAELKGEEPTEQSSTSGDLSAISTSNSP
jgi:ABC-type Zn2+ transport system substrate-binding protein/surface adhesin